MSTGTKVDSLDQENTRRFPLAILSLFILSPS